MISPTVGRVVLVSLGNAHEGSEPYPALVTKVLSDRLIHVAGFTAGGQIFSLTPCVLLQDSDAKPEEAPFAFWMPFQKAQAAALAAEATPTPPVK